jgi:hypothetical protein
MKIIKTFLPLLLLLFVSTFVTAQTVSIPDAEFKNQLVNNIVASTSSVNYFAGIGGCSYSLNASPIDVNGDGEIQVLEAQSVTALELVGYNISSLQGIEEFTNLQCLFIMNLNISNLDLSNNINLIYLECPVNNIDNLTLPNSSQLRQIICSQNNIVNLDVSNNTELEFVDCTDNNFIDLDFIFNTNLIETKYHNNPNLEMLNSKNGRNDLFVFTPSDIPNLLFACVDEDELSSFSSFSESDYPLAQISTYCSFVPGGNYNTITGTTTFDLDSNGCDASDLVIPFTKLNINDGTETGSTFTTNSGEYNFYTQDGTFTVTPDLENPTFFNATPLDATINFTDTNNNIAMQDFCITANGVHNDLEIVMGPTIPARPGFDAEYIITYKNKGNQTLSGDFSFNYNDAVLDFLIATEVPTILNSGQLTWDYTNLLPFESRSVYVTLNVNGPTETPAINIDDQLDFSVAINPIAGDQSPGDNTKDYKQIVVGSYDPNDITCIEGDVLEPSQIGEYLHYIINFENTGNFPAQNIVVATEIDPTMFDVSTFRVISSSHDAYVKQTGDLVEIVFESIYLSSGGHGNILLKVQSQDILVEDDTVTKSANIYFDYNFPIQTNDANTTYQQLLSTTEYGIDQNVTIYPNPVKDWVTISAKDNIKSVSLFDVQGRVLQTKINTSGDIKIDLSTRASGVYFVKIQTEKGIKVEKIIKQ